MCGNMRWCGGGMCTGSSLSSGSLSGGGLCSGGLCGGGLGGSCLWGGWWLCCGTAGNFSHCFLAVARSGMIESCLIAS